jgi:hypothetical protein
MSRAMVICSWNQRRSDAESSLGTIEHGRWHPRRNHLAKQALQGRAVAVSRRRLSSRQFHDPVIENRTPGLERMRHRRAIHFHENVVWQIVMPVPPLQSGQKGAAAGTSILNRVLTRERSARAKDVAFYH